MRSPAAAIAWEFRARHRWGAIALGAYFAVLAAIRFLAIAGGRMRFDSAQSFALVVIVPLTATFIYFLAIFSFGLSGDLAARQSMFPPRMFTLPMTTASLAAWPMIFGSLAMALLWFATRFLGVWPSGSEVPVVWPALLAASLLAWTQALTWMPYPLPGLRVIVTVFWLATIDAIVLVALNVKAAEPAMVAILAPNIPLAYVVARYAVGRARRGDVPDWRFVATSVSSGAADFRSQARAQAWFEWRKYGRSLPALVATVLPVPIAMLFVFAHYSNIVIEILITMLLTPPVMALFVAGTVSNELTPFIATKPVSDASLIASKLKAAMRSALAAWLLVIVAIAIATTLSGTLPILAHIAHTLTGILGAPRALVLAVLVFAALAGSTWKQLVQSLYIGLSGRRGFIKASLFAALVLVAIVVPAGHWIFTDRAAIALLWNAIPWIAAALAAFKLGVAAWIATRLHDRGLVTGRALIFAALLWDVIVFAIFGALVWIVPAMLIPADVLALVAILVVPLARISAAPLTLAWSRHR